MPVSEQYNIEEIREDVKLSKQKNEPGGVGFLAILFGIPLITLILGLLVHWNIEVWTSIF